MLDCLITFRSVTPAQRAEALLHRRGISCVLRRTPKWMEAQGCGYSLRLSCAHVPEALKVLEEKQVPYRKLYRQFEGENPEEMVL